MRSFTTEITCSMHRANFKDKAAPDPVLAPDPASAMPIESSSRNRRISGCKWLNNSSAAVSAARPFSQAGSLYGIRTWGEAGDSRDNKAVTMGSRVTGEFLVSR